MQILENKTPLLVRQVKPSCLCSTSRVNKFSATSRHIGVRVVLETDLENNNTSL